MFQKIYKSCNASPFKKSQFINRQRESEILLSRGWQLLLWLLSPLLWLLQQLHGCIVRPLAATIYRRTRHISDNTPPPDPIAGSWPSEVMYFYLPSQTTHPPTPQPGLKEAGGTVPIWPATQEAAYSSGASSSSAPFYFIYCMPIFTKIYCMPIFTSFTVCLLQCFGSS